MIDICPGINAISAETVGRAWVSYLSRTISQGIKIPDDKEPIYEARATTIFIEKPWRNDDILKRFGDPRIIELYIRKMFSREIIAELNSCYGDRLFDNRGVNQIEWAVERLKSKWWSKAASVGLLIPNDPGPRIPCLTTIQFQIRNDRLLFTATFRSQNVFRAYANFIGLYEVHKVVAEELGIKAGSMTVFCVSPHVYELDLEAAHRVLARSRTAVSRGEPRFLPAEHEPAE